MHLTSTVHIESKSIEKQKQIEYANVAPGKQQRKFNLMKFSYDKPF
jgi:hypothetical protein